jgi:hypothetical protein
MSDTEPTLPDDSDENTTTTEVGEPPTTDTTVAVEAPEVNLPAEGVVEDEATSTAEAPAPSTRTMSDRGIGLELPPGWEGEIYRRSPGEVRYDERVPRDRQLQPTTRSVVHLGSFPLPPDRGDYGSGAVEIMRDEDVLVILFEFEPESATTAQFASSGLPYPIAPNDFDPNQMQRPLPGMAGYQRFFNVDGERSFCLFVVIGSYARRKELAPKINAVLANITITP